MEDVLVEKVEELARKDDIIISLSNRIAEQCGNDLQDALEKDREAREEAKQPNRKYMDVKNRMEGTSVDMVDQNKMELDVQNEKLAAANVEKAF